MVACKYVSLNICSYFSAHEVVFRKDSGNWRSSISYNLCLELMHSILSSAFLKFNWASDTSEQAKLLWQRFCHCAKRYPGNENATDRMFSLFPIRETVNSNKQWNHSALNRKTGNWLLRRIEGNIISPLLFIYTQTIVYCKGSEALTFLLETCVSNKCNFTLNTLSSIGNQTSGLPF